MPGALILPPVPHIIGESEEDFFDRRTEFELLKRMCRRKAITKKIHKASVQVVIRMDGMVEFPVYCLCSGEIKLERQMLNSAGEFANMGNGWFSVLTINKYFKLCLE